jgi:hypothetical protein
MWITQKLSTATHALVARGAFSGVHHSRMGLVDDVQSRARELLQMQAGMKLAPFQVAYLQALRSRLQDHCLVTFTAAQDWLDAFGDAYAAGLQRKG